ncbi:transcriptional regulator, ArsR family [Agrococcus baldri]|uniref:Transcriptional regulator, ArsR family n=1 Tax=Agrococcus baldri TaxID=153730 RepID=A0AA94HLU8_9MICO|nr:metalloregulator ArsR/SmtB family transcription factor [Agrococcus baldri]SFS08914.1 transcriptional regulator, ArsR family [Agrococcus baldri]
MPIATDPLSRIFFALADPTRRAMLERLSAGAATVGELAEPFPISRPAVSQHLGVLEDAGLIERTRQGQWRSCALRPEGLDDAERWVAEHRTAWQSRFDRLDDALANLTGDRGAPAGTTGPGSATATDDADQADASVGEQKEER